MDALEKLCKELTAWQIDNELPLEDPFDQVSDEFITEEQRDYLHGICQQVDKLLGCST